MHNLSSTPAGLQDIARLQVMGDKGTDLKTPTFSTSHPSPPRPVWNISTTVLAFLALRLVGELVGMTTFWSHCECSVPFR